MMSTKFRFAPMIVVSNRERIFFNREQAKRFAEVHNKPILTFYDPMHLIGDTYESKPKRSKDLAAIMPKLKRYFVEGAPCIITRTRSNNVAGK